MPSSDISITALTAKPTVRGNKLAATVLATGPAANIPNLQIKSVIFYASTSNDFTAATEVARGNPEAFDNALIEEQTYYYWARAIDASDNLGAVFPVSPTAGVACTALGMSGLLFGLANGKLAATVAGSNLTIALKTAAGNDASASDPIFAAFRNSALATGSYVVKEVTGPLSLTVASGNTLGATNNVSFRLWPLLVNDGGTMRLAVSNRFNGSAIFGLDESVLINPVSENEVGAGAMDSAGLIYASQAISNAPFRVIGCLDWETALGTAGVWSAGPDKIQMRGPGTLLPGDIVQQIAINDTSTNTGTTTIPLDDTLPQQATEGNLLASSIITPSSKINCIENEFLINCSYSTASHVILALFQDSTANALAAGIEYVPAADDVRQLRVVDRRQAGIATQTSYNWRAGGGAAGTFYYNRISSGRLLGGALSSYKRVTEYMA